MPMSMDRLLEAVNYCADDLPRDPAKRRRLEQCLRDPTLRSNPRWIHLHLGAWIKQQVAARSVLSLLNGNPHLKAQLRSLMDQRAPWGDLVAVLQENSDLPLGAAGSLLYVTGGAAGIQIAAYVQRMRIRPVLMGETVVVGFHGVLSRLGHEYPFIDRERADRVSDFEVVILKR
jgi:hypothetical protein